MTAFLRTIGVKEATGDLAKVYAAMLARPLPPVYRAPHGDAAGIIRIHSLEPALMAGAFGFSGTLATDDTLTWPQRELVNAATSRLNQCFY